MRRTLITTLTVIGALLFGGCSADGVESFLDELLSGTDTSATPDASVDVAAARDALSRLSVRTDVGADMGAYSGQREALFGPAWTDAATGVGLAGNGCDTRNDILARDLTGVTREGACKVVSGTLDPDPYTGERVVFTRGRNTSSAIQVDHVVALGNAWLSGAENIGYPQRVALANDPDNLLAVDGPTNGAKGDKSADQWLPPNAAARCDYVARQVVVKDRYSLSVTEAEKATMTKVLDQCTPAGTGD